jgi:hypothetical protein
LFCLAISTLIAQVCPKNRQTVGGGSDCVLWSALVTVDVSRCGPDLPHVSVILYSIALDEYFDLQLYSRKSNLRNIVSAG